MIGCGSYVSGIFIFLILHTVLLFSFTFIIQTHLATHLLMILLMPKDVYRDEVC